MTAHNYDVHLFLMRTAVIVAFLCGTAALPPAIAVGPVPQAPDEGGPVYPGDRDVGGGAREGPWSATIGGESEPGERLTLTGTVYGYEDGRPRCASRLMSSLSRNASPAKRSSGIHHSVFSGMAMVM